ncbi:MAG: N-acetylneuraminate synthase family protein [Rickettsiales bacterium]|nr:N-acetylneuraminate synthase family protein [Rickettsiales bacterium]
MDFVSKRFDFRQGERCIVIGEIGVNHNRDEAMLFKLIDEGIEAGLDIIKLQRFISEDEISTFAASTEYQKKAGVGESQLAMAKKLELPDAWLIKAFEYCQSRGVGFLCTAFDHSSVDFISKTLGCRSVKVPSPDLTNKPLLDHMAKVFDGMLISTGASTMNECRDAVNWVRQAGAKEIALMHCLSEYPAPVEQTNMRAMVSLHEAFDVPVGYSDHTEGHTVAVVAAALGAAMIEKHYTLDKNLPGPDHKASVNIAELKLLIRAVRDASASLGDGIKQPVAAEALNRPLIRKTAVCALPNLKAGTRLEPAMLAMKRPWTKGAVEPFELERVIGKVLQRDKQFDEPLLWEDVGE